MLAQTEPRNTYGVNQYKWLPLQVGFTRVLSTFFEQHEVLWINALRLISAAVTTDCNATFGRTLQENFAKIESYPLAEANKYFTYLESAISVHSDIVSRPALSTGELPAIVTAASSNHYLESLEMLYSLSAVVRPAYPTIPIYYFDIGLEPHQKLEVYIKQDINFVHCKYNL